MTCNQLAGACDKKFTAKTWEEMMTLSKVHGMEMFQKGDKPHLEAMNKIQGLMQNPEAMNKWFEDKKIEFESLADD